MGKMIQKHKFVSENMDLLRKLTQNGYVSSKLLCYYDIYLTYMSVKDSSKLNRYKIVAALKKTTSHTVRRAVSDMKSYIRD